MRGDGLSARAGREKDVDKRKGELIRLSVME